MNIILRPNRQHVAAYTDNVMIHSTTLETGENSGRPEATTESEDKFLSLNRLHDRQLTEQFQA